MMNRYKLGNWEFDVHTYSCESRKSPTEPPFSLPTQQGKMLRALIQAYPAPVSQEALATAGKSKAADKNSVVRTQMNELRRQFGDDKFVIAERNLGYKLGPKPEPVAEDKQNPPALDGLPATAGTDILAAGSASSNSIAKTGGRSTRPPVAPATARRIDRDKEGYVTTSRPQEASHDRRHTNFVDPEFIAEQIFLTGQPLPAYLRSLIHKLNFTHKNFDDLGALAELTGLVELDLGSTGVSDLSPIKGLVNLEYLHLVRTRITDLTPLTGLTNLRHLDLERTPVKDLSPLSGLTRLEWLDLDGTQVADISPLEALVAMRRLDITRTYVVDLAPARHLSELRVLDMKFTDIEDISPLSGLLRLEHLYLEGTMVTDLQPVSHLANLKIHQ